MLFSQSIYEVAPGFMLWHMAYLFSIGLCVCRLWFGMLCNMERYREIAGRPSLLEGRKTLFLVLPALLGIFASHPVFFILVHVSLFTLAPDTMSVIGSLVALILGILSLVGSAYTFAASKSVI